MLPYYFYDLRDLTKVDIAFLVLAGTFAAGFGISGWHRLVLLPFLIAVMLIEVLHGLRLALAFRSTLPATGQVVSHSTRLLFEPGTRYTPSEEWVYWSPVVAYETADGQIQAQYPIYTLHKWFDDEDLCEIRYSRRNPSLFYIEGRRGETVYKNLTGFLIAAVITALYAAIAFFVFI